MAHSSISQSIIALGALIFMLLHVARASVVYHDDFKVGYNSVACEEACDGAWQDARSVTSTSKSTGGSTSQSNDGSSAEPQSSSTGLVVGLVIIFVLLASLAGLLIYLYLRRRRLRRNRGTQDIEAPPPSATLTGRFSRFSGKDQPQFAIVPFHVPSATTSAGTSATAMKEWEAIALATISYGGSGINSPADESRLSQIMFSQEAPPAYADSVGLSDFDQESPLRTHSANPSCSSSLTYRTITLPSPLQKSPVVVRGGSSSVQNSPVDSNPTRSANAYRPDVKVDPFAKSSRGPTLPQDPVQEPEQNSVPTTVPETSTHIEEPPRLHLRAQTPFQMHFRESAFTAPAFNLNSLRKPTSASMTSSQSTISMAPRPALPERIKSRAKSRSIRVRDDYAELAPLSISRSGAPLPGPSATSSSAVAVGNQVAIRQTEATSAKLPTPKSPAASPTSSSGRKHLVLPSKGPGDARSGARRKGKPSRGVRSTYASFLPEMGDE